MTPTKPTLGRELRAVVLVGARDFGRCPLAARMPAALWPIGEKSSLARLLDHLAEEGMEQATVCCGTDVMADVELICRSSSLAVTIAVEEILSGTGGCLRDAVSSDPGDLIVMLSGSMAAPPPLADLVGAHQSGGADMTVVFNPGYSDPTQPGPAAEIVLCEPKVLDHIPGEGYSDIKEGVIPALLRAGGTVRPLVLSRSVGNFHDRRGYLDAIDTLFRSGRLGDREDGSRRQAQDRPIYQGREAFVHPDARICGPVLIGDRARVLEGALVVGPAMLGPDAVVGENSAMIRSALWAGARTGTSCEIRESIVDSDAVVPDGTKVIGRALAARSSARVGRSVPSLPWWQSLAEKAGPLTRRLDRLVRLAGERAGMPPRQMAVLLAGVVVLAALAWSYWPTLLDLVSAWKTSDEYSSGLLVPFLAIYVIWLRREEIGSVTPCPAVFGGALAFLFAQAVRAAGMFFMYQFAERLSLLLSLVAMALLLTGWRYLKKLAPILLFLCLMLPWPNRIQAAVSLTLQRWATGSAVFCLELAGCDIIREGNLITMRNVTVGVAEACNGLRMITAFFVISALVALITHRAWWEKLVVLASSLPIALCCNTVRLVVTTVLYTIVTGEAERKWIHDGDGYAMMPLALALVVGELWLLSRLTTPPTRIEPAIISRQRPQHVSDP